MKRKPPASLTTDQYIRVFEWLKDHKDDPSLVLLRTRQDIAINASNALGFHVSESSVSKIITTRPELFPQPQRTTRNPTKSGSDRVYVVAKAVRELYRSLGVQIPDDLAVVLRMSIRPSDDLV